MSRGHGWVTKNADGFRARCGGPGLCPQCRREAVALAALNRPQTEARPGWHWVQDARTLDVLVRAPDDAEYVLPYELLHATPPAVVKLMNVMVDALTHPPAEPPAPLVLDLAAMVRRLAYAVGKERANLPLREQAMAFLKSHGLDSDVLRDAEEIPPQ